MKLRCKKTYYINVLNEYPRYGQRRIPRIREGECYEVLKQYSKSDGRYWLFAVSDEVNKKKDTGWFIVDEYFETPEEMIARVRNNKLEEIIG